MTPGPGAGPPARGRAVARVLQGAGFAGVALVLLLVSGVLPLQAVRVPSDSMSPAIAPGDHLLLDRRHADVVTVGDVVVLRDPRGDGEIVKRVVAVGGDTVGIEDGVVVRNGAPVAEPYAHDPLDGVYYGPDVVPAGCVYVLGDHRGDSVDSRHFGPVPLSSVVGRVTARLFPSPRALGRGV